MSERHLLISLDEADVLRKIKVVSAVDDELFRFDEYMDRARGLARSTRMQRLKILRSFLLQSHVAGSRVLRSPTQDEVRQFIETELRRLCPASVKLVAGTLRAYLRFRATLGDSVAHLLPVIASANRRLATLPQTLSQEEIVQLLDAFPQGLPSRRRGYAMVRCLVDLGLRASEVVSIDLDDIDWEAGTLRIVKNKSRRVDVLPLPQSTGQAIATYRRAERPSTTSRRVFVRHVAPAAIPIGPEVLRKIVREAYCRCGLLIWICDFLGCSIEAARIHRRRLQRPAHPFRASITLTQQIRSVTCVAGGLLCGPETARLRGSLQKPSNVRQVSVDDDSDHPARA